jgi:hypothetical protein
LFAGWSGACSGTAPCRVTMSAARSVTAVFTRQGVGSYALTIAKTGQGAGTVTSSPGGISCGSDCAQSYSSGTLVTLSPTAAAGSAFAGWGGACTGTGACRVTMSAARAVTAVFVLRSYPLAVGKAGTGAGTVTSSPAGIICGSHCSQAYTSGTIVTLYPHAASGSTFSRWTGACYGSSATCRVGMAAAKSVTATFSASTPTSTASTAKNGDVSASASSSTASGAPGPLAGDFDGDGNPDLLWHNPKTGQLKAWLLDHGTLKADPDITPDGPADAGWQVRGVADLNGDGQSDILWRHQRTGALRVWLMNQTALVDDVELTQRRVGRGWQIGGVADFNGDGKPDILWHDARRGSLVVWLMDGTTAVGETILAPEGSTEAGWRINGLADFDGDGQADILWRHEQTGALRVWLVKGGKAAGSVDLLPSRVADPRWQIVRVADLDGDGKTDILWHNRLTGDLLVWYMDGIKMVRRAPLEARQPDPDWAAAPGAAGADPPDVKTEATAER